MLRFTSLEATLERLKQHRRALIIQDTSELDYTKKNKLKGKGPLSTEYRTGFFSHNHFIVTPEGIPIGVWDTKIYARDNAEHGKSEDRKKKPIEAKESIRWLEGYRQACHLSDLAPETEIISCADRECDIYEVFEEWHQRRKNGAPVAEILIRSCYDRKVIHGSQGDEKKIFTKLSAAPLLGTVDIYVKRKIQSKRGVSSILP